MVIPYTLINFNKIKMLKKDQLSDTGNILNFKTDDGKFTLILKVTAQELVLLNKNLLCCAWVRKRKQMVR